MPRFEKRTLIYVCFFQNFNFLCFYLDKILTASNQDEFAPNPFDKVRKAIKFKSVVSKWKKNAKATNTEQQQDSHTEYSTSSEKAPLSKRRSSNSPELVKKLQQQQNGINNNNNKKQPDSEKNNRKKSIQCEEEINDISDKDIAVQLGEVNAIGTALEKYLNVISTYSFFTFFLLIIMTKFGSHRLKLALTSLVNRLVVKFHFTCEIFLVN